MTALATQGARLLLALALALASCSGGEGTGDAGTTDGAPDGAAAEGGAGDADGEVAADGAPAEGLQPLEQQLFQGEASKCLEPSLIVKALRERARELDRRAAALVERERSLSLLTKAIDERLVTLEKTRDSALEQVDLLADVRAGNCREQEKACAVKLASLEEQYGELERGLERWSEAQTKQIDELRGQELAKLTKAITSMRPEQAAATLGALDHAMAAEIIRQLPERSSGQILAALEPTKTAAIVQTLLAQAEPAGREALREAGRAEQAADGGPDGAAAPQEERVQ